ncbi:MAG: hypothetical protein Q8L14_27805 [Myxococcales bacterium]|nr:hypothetical protein [Myxococcales bacterium]
MLCIAFFVCLIVVLRRRKTGTTIVVPLAVLALSLVRAALLFTTVVILISTFKKLGGVPAENKQAVLSTGIDEAMQYVQFGAFAEFPLLIGAWVLDGVLRKRRRSVAQLAPTGSRCATHADSIATHICSRCGAFMCSVCGTVDGLCGTCLARGA